MKTTALTDYEANSAKLSLWQVKSSSIGHSKMIMLGALFGAYKT